MNTKMIALLGILGLGGLYIWMRYGKDEMSDLRKQYNVPRGAREVIDETGVHWTWEGGSASASWEDVGSLWRGIIGLFTGEEDKKSKAQELMDKATSGNPLSQNEAGIVIAYAVDQGLITDDPGLRAQFWNQLRSGYWRGFAGPSEDLGAVESPLGIYEGYGPGWLVDQVAYR